MGTVEAYMMGTLEALTIMGSMHTESNEILKFHFLWNNRRSLTSERNSPEFGDSKLLNVTVAYNFLQKNALKND